MAHHNQHHRQREEGFIVCLPVGKNHPYPYLRTSLAPLGTGVHQDCKSSLITLVTLFHWLFWNPKYVIQVNTSNDLYIMTSTTNSTMTTREKIRSIVNKGFAMNSKPTEASFPERPDFLVIIRFVLGVTFGTYLGWNGTRSGVMVLQALNLIAFIPVMYCRWFLYVEQGHFDTQIIFSGTFHALAVCLLIWIYFFTAQHTEEEDRLAALLISTSIPDQDVPASVDRLVESNVDADVPLMEEPEF